MHHGAVHAGTLQDLRFKMDVGIEFRQFAVFGCSLNFPHRLDDAPGLVPINKIFFQVANQTGKIDTVQPPIGVVFL